MKGKFIAVVVAAVFSVVLAGSAMAEDINAYMGTSPDNNAKIANRYWDPKVGALREGYAADVILMDYWPPTPFDEGTFLGHLGFGLAQSFVDTTICGGKVLMEGKKLKIDVDEEEVAAKSLELSRKLWQRF